MQFSFGMLGRRIESLGLSEKYASFNYSKTMFFKTLDKEIDTVLMELTQFHFCA